MYRPPIHSVDILPCVADWIIVSTEVHISQPLNTKPGAMYHPVARLPILIVAQQPLLILSSIGQVMASSHIMHMLGLKMHMLGLRMHMLGPRMRGKKQCRCLFRL